MSEVLSEVNIFDHVNTTIYIYKNKLHAINGILVDSAIFRFVNKIIAFNLTKVQ